MKWLLELAMVVSVLTVTTPGAFAKAPPGAPKSDVVSDAAIRKLYDEFTTAWNRHDAPTLARMWTLDGDHVEPDGNAAKGRDQIEAMLTKQHGSVFSATRLTLSIDQIWFVTGDVALVDGTYEVDGIKNPAGQDVGARKGHLTAVFLKENGRWWIAADRLMIPAALPWRTDGK